MTISPEFSEIAGSSRVINDPSLLFDKALYCSGLPNSRQFGLEFLQPDDEDGVVDIALTANDPSDEETKDIVVLRIRTDKTTILLPERKSKQLEELHVL